MSQQRRQARLRGEYLYRKHLTGEQRVQYEQKKRVRDALNTGKALPTELRGDFDSLHKDLSYDDRMTEKRLDLDDEYADAGAVDPKIMVTTARSASSRLMQFSKEMRLLFPNSFIINRGGTQLKELVEAGIKNNFTDIVIVMEHRGEPDGLIVSHLPFGPTAHFNMSNCVMRHDLPKDTLGNMSEAYPHLIFDGFESKLGVRVRNILKFLFPVPKPDSKRVITFSNQKDSIEFRHHTYQTARDANPNKAESVELSECGPRFTLRCFQVTLGVLGDSSAQNEWVLRPYMNTAKKRKLL